MLDSRRLRVLCEVARHGSFSAAAVALGYTQPAISRQILVRLAERQKLEPIHVTIGSDGSFVYN